MTVFGNPAIELTKENLKKEKLMSHQAVFNNIPIEQIEVGMEASYSQTITDADIKGFAGISGDRNPVHIDEEYAENSRYKKTYCTRVNVRILLFRFIWHKDTR